MIIENSLMRKDNLKCQSYGKTINQIKNAFNRLGLKLLFHKPIKNPRVYSYSCKIEIPELNVSTAGKGTNRKQAIASALGEMAERLSANYMFKYFYPAYSQISDELILRFNNGEHLPGYIQAHKDDLNDHLSISDLFKNFHFKLNNKQLSELADLEIAQHWVDGYSLLQKKKIKIPLRIIKSINRSNGLAAGNSIEEAIVQASCEIFERFSQITIFRNKSVLPTIDATTIKDKTIQKMIKEYKKIGVEILLKDFSLDNLIPVVGVVFINSKNTEADTINYKFEHIQVRSGSSFNLNDAIKRCFTEQISGMTINKSLVGYTKHLELLLKNLEKKVEFDVNSYLGLFRRARYAGDKTFLLRGEKRKYREFDTSNNFLDYIEQIKTICKKLDTDFIIVDHTHPIIKFPTIRVIMPGISEVINYTNYDFDSLKNSLIYGVQDYETKQKFLPEFSILTEKDLNELEDQILTTYLIKGDNFLGNISNELNSAKNFHLIMSSIYFRKAKFDKFAYLAKSNANHFSGKIRRDYKYLELLTKYFMKTRNEEIRLLITDYFNKMLGCHRYLTDSTNNFYTNWCEQPCEKNCEQKYRLTLNRVVKSFFN
ncbi:MAG: hypothetical protein EAX90_15520 [Candidatus Heimdallarchaeota archaeon]|nr:hypothetical protein [Candidatus Heimdallarchaeota archaeon]